MSGRYAQCDNTCTVDCGRCKGGGRPSLVEYRTAAYARMRAEGEDPLTPVYAADVTREPTGGPGLREAVACGLESLPSVRVNANRPGEVPGYWTGRLTPPETTHLADAVLALPEMAALIADADNWRRVTTGDPTEPEPLAMQARDLLVRCRELEATVARVRELADELDRGYVGTAGEWARGAHYAMTVAADCIRRALDGEPQP